MKDTGDHSDTESFHSAISSTKKTVRQRTVPEGQASKKPRCRRSSTRHRRNLISQSDDLTSSEDIRNPTETDRSISRPCSSRSRPRQTDHSIPRRQSSLNLGRKKRRHSSRKDPTSLHRQSCQLFSSLDGVLAISREFTPLPSVSTTRTSTRHPSLVPEDTPGSYKTNTDMEQQLCHSVDEKLKVVEREQQTHPYHRRSMSSSPPTFRPSYSESSLVYQSRIVTPRISISVSDVYSYGQRNSMSAGNDMRLPPSVRSRPPLNAVISWTSNATRREEYEKIDRAHSGVRGFLRKMLPKCMHSKNARRAFYTGGDGDGDDGHSVRRFRMSLDDADETTDDERVTEKHDDEDREIVDALDVDEKGVHTSKQCLAVLAEPVTISTATATARIKPATEGKKHRWTCFQ
ncbi:hypothetical protein RBB50_002677 [Rhinocladiella similis]